MKNAILVVSHGSRSPQTKAEIEQLVTTLRRELPDHDCRYAFLELESPDIPEGIADCVEAGAERVLVLLNFLNSGRHVDEDIPRIVEESRRSFPHVQIAISEPLGQQPEIPSVFRAMVEKSF